MIRKFAGWLLRADLAPSVVWPARASEFMVAQFAVDIPRGPTRTDRHEQILQQNGEEFVLVKRWRGSGLMQQISFRGPLSKNDLRINLTLDGPRPIYRLKLCPENKSVVQFNSSEPAWIGLWWNEQQTYSDAILCFIDSHSPDELAALRSRLLNGDVPESLIREEELQRRIDALPEDERRSAMAAIASDTIRELDRQFQANHPDAGPVPESLKPLADVVERQKQEIERAANLHSQDVEVQDRNQKQT